MEWDMNRLMAKLNDKQISQENKNKAIGLLLRLWEIQTKNNIQIPIPYVEAGFAEGEEEIVEIGWVHKKGKKTLYFFFDYDNDGKLTMAWMKDLETHETNDNISDDQIAERMRWIL